MKTSAGFMIRLTTVATMLFWLAGCGPEADCPVCGNDGSTCDAGDDAGDIIAGDIGIDTTARPDAADSNDDTDFTDIDLPEITEDATEDVEINDFLTGTGRIIGRAHFTNMNDHSGFEIKLYNKDSNAYLEWLPVLASTVTGPDGTYSFDKVPSGLYQVAVTHGPMTVEGLKVWGPMGVDEGKTETAIDFAFTAIGAIEGQLIFPVELAEPELKVAFTEGRNKLVIPDADGYFNFYGMRTGEYKVCVGATLLTGKCFDPVTVVGLAVTSLGKIKMTLWDQTSGPGVDVVGNVKMFGMTDHSGIEVVYQSAESEGTTTTDAEGNYSFQNVAPGAVQFKFNAPEGSGFERDSASEQFVFYAGTSELLAPLTLVRGKAVWRTDSLNLAARDAVFSPDSKSVVLRSYDFINIPYPPDLTANLYSVNVASGRYTLLAESIDKFLVSPDSTTVIYTHAVDNRLLFSVPLEGGTRQCLTTESVEFLTISPDSRYAIYSNYVEHGFQYCYASDVVTGTQHQLCAGKYNSITSDSRFVFCLSEFGYFEAVELGDGSSVYQNNAVTRFISTQDQKTIFLCGNDGSAEAVDLETGTVTPLADEIPDCTKMLLTPSGNIVVYQSSTGQLKAATLDGGAPIVLAEGDAYPLMATPDSTRVIFSVGSFIENPINPPYPNYMGDLYVTDISGLTLPALLMSGWYGKLSDLNSSSGREDQTFFVDRNSDALFLAQRFQDRTSVELVRISLDDSQSTSFGYLCNFNCQGSDQTWFVDDNNGLVYTYKPGGKVQTLNMVTGAVMYDSNESIGLGLMASDLSGTAVASSRNEAFIWLSFPDLNYTALAPWPSEYNVNTVDGTSHEMAISPDNSLVMFKSTFGGASYPDFYYADFRLMIAPLKQD